MTNTLLSRFYTQIIGEKARQLSQKREARRNASDVGATRIDDHGITANEVLAQLNRIMAPWKVEFASAMSWFAVWRGQSFGATIIHNSD
jgi:phenol 2-monooxygenase